MTFITVDSSRKNGRGFARNLVVITLVALVALPFKASAEWLTVEMEDAKETIYLDTVKGAFYVGSDCTPLFYFSEKLKSRSKSLKLTSKYYSVEKNRSRSLRKSALPSRLPTLIIVDESTVKILSESMMGRAQAKGKVRPTVLSGRKKATQCK